MWGSTAPCPPGHHPYRPVKAPSVSGVPTLRQSTGCLIEIRVCSRCPTVVDHKPLAVIRLGICGATQLGLGTPLGTTYLLFDPFAKVSSIFQTALNVIVFRSCHKVTKS